MFLKCQTIRQSGRRLIKERIVPKADLPPKTGHIESYIAVALFLLNGDADERYDTFSDCTENRFKPCIFRCLLTQIGVNLFSKEESQLSLKTLIAMFLIFFLLQR